MFGGAFDGRSALGPLIAVALIAGVGAGLSTAVSGLEPRQLRSRARRWRSFRTASSVRITLAFGTL